ncbi:MFS transporter [Methylobacterium frigidaeris]|uniref:Multidrug resistance protein Stp n=3 Tax=Methylobacterium frigidaeris TaxID=2038277 RepID=A0AA37H6Y7_9HYPH|nr:MFS transporter [Methylobacterium frigidaeris]GJD60015.1 Multidrug resistance protein Stp [Methylobacterium frigidaeris]
MSVHRTPRNVVALAAVCLSALMLGLEISSIPAILPTLEQVLPADFRELQWIMNAYTIAMTTWLMAMGALADRFGRKRVFLAGIGVFGAASLICGLAASAALLIAARFLQGTSAAAMLACQIAVLSHQFRDGPDRGVAFGWWGIIFGIGLGFGPLVGGAIVALSTWHWVFLIHAVLAVGAMLLARAGVEESSDPHAVRIDLAGMVTLSLAVFCLVFLITRGQALSPDDPAGLVTAAIGALSVAAFVAVEIRTVRPMFDFRAFRIRRFSGALIGASGMNFSFWPFVIYVPIHFQAVLGLDSVGAGLALLAYTLPTLFVPPVAEALLRRHGPHRVIPLGLFTIGLGFVLMRAATAADPASWAALLPGCLLAGAGLGLTNTPVTNTATAAVPAERAGMASGMDMSARMISLAINIALMGVILVQGIRASLARLLPQAEAGLLDRLAETIAAGNLTAGVPGGIELGAVAGREALLHGFGWVMLYAAFCAWAMAALSLAVFGHRPVLVEADGRV